MGVGTGLGLWRHSPAVPSAPRPSARGQAGRPLLLPHLPPRVGLHRAGAGAGAGPPHRHPGPCCTSLKARPRAPPVRLPAECLPSLLTEKGGDLALVPRAVQPVTAVTEELCLTVAPPPLSVTRRRKPVVVLVWGGFDKHAECLLSASLRRVLSLPPRALSGLRKVPWSTGGACYESCSPEKGGRPPENAQPLSHRARLWTRPGGCESGPLAMRPPSLPGWLLRASVVVKFWVRECGGAGGNLGRP